MFSYLMLLIPSGVIAVCVVAAIIYHEAKKSNKPFLSELVGDGNGGDDLGAAAVVTGLLFLVSWGVLSAGNGVLGWMYPGPQAHLAVELGPVFRIERVSDSQIEFVTRRRMEHEEEGFFFHWTEGDFNEVGSVYCTEEQKGIIDKTFVPGKSYVATYTKDGKNLASFYPSE